MRESVFCVLKQTKLIYAAIVCQYFSAQVYDRIVKEHRKERAKMVLWRKPLLTLFYFARELVDELHTLSHR